MNDRDDRRRLAAAIILLILAVIAGLAIGLTAEPDMDTAMIRYAQAETSAASMGIRPASRGTQHSNWGIMPDGTTGAHTPTIQPDQPLQ